MGESQSKPISNHSKAIDSITQLEQIYSMYGQSIYAAHEVRLLNSKLGQSQTRSVICRIGNLDSILEQLLDKFKNSTNYVWGEEIYFRFKKHFFRSFQEAWLSSKEDFYQFLITNATVENRAEAAVSYQRYFYDIVAKRLEFELPRSFTDEEGSEEETKMAVNAINLSIIGMVDQQGSNQKEKDDFLPLFGMKNSTKRAKKKGIDGKSQKKKSDLIQFKQKQQRSSVLQLKKSHMDASSVILPDVVFIDRMSLQSKNQVYDLVVFYKHFSNTLQQIFFSCSLISCPLKHFLFTLKEKMKRKKIRNGQNTDPKGNQVWGGSSDSFVKRALLLSDTTQGENLRRKRQFNNEILLDEVKDFTEAYTDFIWKYLQLFEIGDTRLGKLITIDTLYGIVLKNVWGFIGWIGERGFEYEDNKLEIIYPESDQPLKYPLKANAAARNYLLSVLLALREEKIPQRYLKRIVLFYRQVSKHCETADDLLNTYEDMLVKCVRMRASKSMSLFRMQCVIDRVLKMDDCYADCGGQINYSWTTWCIAIQILKSKIQAENKKSKQNESNPEKAPRRDEEELKTFVQQTDKKWPASSSEQWELVQCDQ